MLGIPTHLAPRVSAWSMVRAFHTAAIGSLVVAAVVVALSAVSNGTPGLWSALAALVVMIATAAVHVRVRDRWSAAALLVVGGVCSWWIGDVVTRDVPGTAVQSSLVSLTIIPLVLVGGGGTRPPRVIGWAVAGFVVGRVATLLGALQAGGTYRPAILAWVTLVLTIGVVAGGTRTAGRARRVERELLQSAREEHAAAYRQRIELEAAAILHDTVLSHLNAIAIAPPGALDPDLASTVDEDLAVFAGQGWLSGTRSEAPVEGGSAFAAMVDSYRSPGEFGVDVSGDLRVLGGLAPEVFTALVGAVGQCLANVRKHADIDCAEVNVFDDGRSCTVMVVDGGKGFDQSATGADRLGLKNSVRQRIERVAGEVQLWSAPGSGTSVMLTVPMQRAPTGAGAAAGATTGSVRVHDMGLPAGPTT